MTPPGLTCVRCEQPLYPEPVRATEAGWKHVDCPRSGCCQQCGTGLIPYPVWREMTAAERDEAKRNGMNREGGRATCRNCYQRERRRLGDEAGREAVNRQRQDRIEDIEWLAETGESWEMALIRLGLSDGALDHFLRRADRLDLMVRLRGSQVAA